MNEMERYDELGLELHNVLETLEDILKERLDEFGLYYRMFSRIKSGASIVRKLQSERYAEDKERKISDLFGIRVMLYYEDDIEACKMLFDDLLTQERWKETGNGTSIFDATKNNGTFELPGFLKKIVLPEIEGLRINPTFEVQIRTVFFEGWHESEHDLRYKEQDEWTERQKESRRLNSILATLEMCDKYMVDLYDDMGHSFYKERLWQNMIKFRYRLKKPNGILNEELARNISVPVGKSVFKRGKARIVAQALAAGFKRLDADIIVYLINEEKAGTPDYVPEIHELFNQLRLGKRQFVKDASKKNINALVGNTAFNMTMKLDEGEDIVKSFEKMKQFVKYDWLEASVGEYFEGAFTMEEGCNFRYIRPGMEAVLQCDDDACRLFGRLEHLGMDAASKIWRVEIRIYRQEDGLYVNVWNQFLIPKHSSKEVQNFSRPKMYLDFVEQFPMKDVLMLSKKIQHLDDNNFDSVIAGIENPNRRLPVVIFTSERVKEVLWQLDKTHVMQRLRYIAHVFMADAREAEKLAQYLGEDSNAYKEGVRYFLPGFLTDTKSGYMSFDERDILNKPKELFALRSTKPYQYRSVDGFEAVLYDITQRTYDCVTKTPELPLF